MPDWLFPCVVVILSVSYRLFVDVTVQLSQCLLMLQYSAASAYLCYSTVQPVFRVAAEEIFCVDWRFCAY